MHPLFRQLTQNQIETLVTPPERQVHILLAKAGTGAGIELQYSKNADFSGAATVARAEGEWVLLESPVYLIARGSDMNIVYIIE
jgi:hypothetical protein